MTENRPRYKRISTIAGKDSDKLLELADEIDAGIRQAFIRDGDTYTAANRDHPLMLEVRAWLDGKRQEHRTDYRYNDFTRQHTQVGSRASINRRWMTELYLEDINIAAELEAAKARIAELEAELAALETGGIQVEGKEAPELDYAIALYRAVATTELPAGLTPAKALLEKAEKLFPDMAPEAHKRLATVANWEKERGRRKK